MSAGLHPTLCLLALRAQVVPGFTKTGMLDKALIDAQDPRRATYTGAASLAKLDSMLVRDAPHATPPEKLAAAVVRAAQRKGGPPRQLEVGRGLGLAKMLSEKHHMLYSSALRDWVVGRHLGLLPRARALKGAAAAKAQQGAAAV